MRFEWDEAKRFSNIRTHEIDFAELEPLFTQHTFTIQDDRFDYPEERFVTYGWMNGVLLAIVHTERENMVRLISARKATRNEQECYFEQVGYGLGTPEEDGGQ